MLGPTISETKQKTPKAASEVIAVFIDGLYFTLRHNIMRRPHINELLKEIKNSGRKHEEERTSIIIGWLWNKVLPSWNETAEKIGVLPVWKTMLSNKTETNVLVCTATLLPLVDKAIAEHQSYSSPYVLFNETITQSASAACYYHKKQGTDNLLLTVENCANATACLLSRQFRPDPTWDRIEGDKLLEHLILSH